MKFNGLGNVLGILTVLCASAVIATLAGSQPAWGAYDLLTIADEPVTITGSLRAREEVWNWFGPGTVKSGQDDNRYHFLGGFLRLGAGYQYEGVKGFLELEVPYLVNLPDDALAPAPQGGMGLGANYYQPNNASNSASVFLKQGYVEFGKRWIPELDFKGGRFEFLDGTEFPVSDPELGWIVKNRIAQRLIGNFGFSDVMRSFDGALATYGNDKWQATAMYAIPTKGVFDLQGMNEISNTDLAYASLSAGPNKYWGNSIGRIFYIYYNDSRGLAPVDNRSTTARNIDRRAIDISTAGLSYAGTKEIGPGVADLMLWGAGQLGGWGRLSQEAWAGTIEGGYKLPSVPWQPWVRFGYTSTSGDGNPNDSTHGTFFQILPTPRVYAMTPFYNLMNIDDAMAQLVLAPFKQSEVQTSLHGLWLSANKDLWYAGGGEFDNNIFGYVGRPSNGRSYLGTLLDCQWTWKVNDHMTTIFYYGHTFGGSVPSAIYPGGKEMDYGFIEVMLYI